METVATGNVRKKQDVLFSLREKALGLVMKSENKDDLEQVVALLSDKKRPCAYTREEMAESLREAEADYKAGRYVIHEDLFKELIMKTLSKIICFACITMSIMEHAKAQDLIVTKDKQFINAYQIDIGKYGVYYLFDKDDTVYQHIAISNILIIQLEDGTKIDPEKNVTTDNALFKKKPNGYNYKSSSESYAGTGAGNGEFFLDGRPVVKKAYPKARVNTSGLVIVEFHADPEGNVVYTKAGVRGTTINDAELWAECERAAKQSKFKAKVDAVSEQKGTIRYRFVSR